MRMAEFSFPLEEFPVYRPHGDATARGQRGENQQTEQFNTVPYGRISAMLDAGEGVLIFRQQGRDRHVCYQTPCLPLTPPNTRTPYDNPVEVTHNHPQPGMKYRVLSRVYYLHGNFPNVYVPVDVLTSQLQTANTLEDQLTDFDTTLGSAMAFLPVSHPGCHGVVFFASGPNLQTLTVGLLLEPAVVLGDSTLADSPPDNSFLWFSRHSSRLHLEPTEGYRLPSRIQQVDSVTVRGRAVVSVRSDGHVIFFEGPTERGVARALGQYRDSVTQHPPTAPTFKVHLLQCLVALRSTVSISHVKLSPYIAGEAIVLTESGGVYLWREKERLRTLQEPQATPTPADPAHFWQCCYGAHPRCVVLAEQSGVSLGDFRGNGGLIFTPLLTHPSPHLPSHTTISAISPHPSHPFYLFIATSRELLLLDTRQPDPPLLATQHEFPDPPRFISTLCNDNRDTLVVLSSHHSHESIVYCCSGGTSESAGMLAPHFSCLPHLTANYSEFGDSLNHLAAVTHVGYRFKQPLSGSCVINLLKGSYTTLTMTTLGDIFFQCWCYQHTPPIPRPHIPSSPVPPIPEGYYLWLQEAWHQEEFCYRDEDRSSPEQFSLSLTRSLKLFITQMYDRGFTPVVPPQQLIRHREMSAGVGARTLDFGPLLEYLVDSDSADLCLYCHQLASSHFQQLDISKHRTTLRSTAVDKCAGCHDDETVLFQAEELSQSQREDRLVKRCSFCGQKIEPLSWGKPGSGELRVTEKGRGMEVLRKGCVWREAESELEVKLVRGWESRSEGDGDSGKEDTLHTPLQTQPSHSPPESTISDGIEHKLTPSTPTPKKTRTPHRIGF